MTPETRFIFFGNAEFSKVILEKLVEAGYMPDTLVCSPDKPVGRRHLITPPLVKQLITGQKLKTKIMQPETKQDLLDTRYSLLDTTPDFAIVAAYPKILPKEILDIPRLGTIGVHPSLLPKYRGATPIQSAILDGETKTGTTLYVMDEKIDHGSIVTSKEYRVQSSDNYETLQKKLAELAAKLLIETLPKFIEGKIAPIPQNESEATYTKKFKTEDGFIDLEKDDPQMIIRKIKALNPEPGVWFTGDRKRTKILDAEIDSNGKLVLKKIQIEGQKPKGV